MNIDINIELVYYKGSSDIDYKIDLKISISPFLKLLAYVISIKTN